MKKTLAMLLVFVMLFSLCACGKDETNTTDPSNSSQSTTGNTECNHTWVDATCTTAKTCSACGETEGDAIGHTWADATCTAPKTCSACGETEGDAIGHTWADATCTTAKTCSVCGETEGEANGHTWKDATCTTPKTCSKCKATEGKAKGHSWKDATCTAPKTCSKCNATEGDAKGHSYTNGACSVCGAADPSYKQLTEGYWIHITEYRIAKITFNEEGIADIYRGSRVSAEEYQSQQARIKELKDTYGSGWYEYWDEPFYSTWTIDGVEYYLDAWGWGGLFGYSENNGVVDIYIKDEPTKMERTSGNQLTVTAVGDYICGDGAVYTWAAELVETYENG